MLRLVSAGGSIEEFQWSTNEQVWPFEKASDGSTLYAKEVDFGYLPNTGYKGEAHNISNFEFPHSVSFTTRRTTSHNLQLDTVNVWSSVSATTIGCQSNSNLSDMPAFCRLVYTKTT